MEHQKNCELALSALCSGSLLACDSAGLRSFSRGYTVLTKGGHGRTVYHNDVQRELSRLARAVGHQLRETPQDVFLPAVAAGARADYLEQIRRGRAEGNFRGGVVPDLYDPSSRQMYDVKTTGFKQITYIARRSAVDEKAADVPAQYRRRARDADRTYHDTPEGAVGPIETMLATMP